MMRARQEHLLAGYMENMGELEERCKVVEELNGQLTQTNGHLIHEIRKLDAEMLTLHVANKELQLGHQIFDRLRQEKTALEEEVVLLTQKLLHQQVRVPRAALHPAHQDLTGPAQCHQQLLCRFQGYTQTQPAEHVNDEGCTLHTTALKTAS